eukprot:6633636-Pyramimonas_sp.AAC.1
MLLVNPEVAKVKLMSICSSGMDEYTKGFLDYYGIDNVDGEFALAELTAISMLAQLDTVQLENGNA